MNRNLLIIAAILLLTASSYFGYYHYATTETAAMVCKVSGEMEWLRHEFKLTDEQYKKIKELHESYRPRCEKMCEKIAVSRASLDHLIDTNRKVTPEVESAFKDYASLEEECRQAMMGHMNEISAAMSAERGARYVQMMKEHILLPSNISHTTLGGMHHH